MPRRENQKNQGSQRLGLGRGLTLGALAALACGVSACDGCGSQKPYTPFGVASALPSAEPVLAALPELGVAPVASSGFAVRKAELVPAAAEAWQGSGLSLNAPSARRFAQVLPGDFDDDQKLDALGWLVPAPGEKNAPPGELWYFPNGAAARKLSALPGFVPSSPDCALNVTLTQTGPHSATLDALAICKSLIARAPTRALLVVSPSVEHPLLLTLRAASAAPDETLSFSVDSSDQDHDGRDDVRLTLSLAQASPSEPTSADLVWLDRAAGASRSASEPLASLLRLAGKIGVRARTKHGTNTAERVASVLRLLSSLCAEGGVARVFDEDGVPFRCGDLGKIIDSLTLSDVLGAIAQGDVQSAFSALRRDGWYFAKLSNAQRKSVERELLRAVTRFDADPPVQARTQPIVPALPHYSPLWFESDGALLVHGAAGVTRLSADRATEEPISAEAGAPNWPLDLVAPSGQRVLGAVHACDRSELLLNESDAQHPLLPPLATRLIAARPASCTGHGTGPSVLITPLNFDDNGLEALIGGVLVNVAPLGKKPVPGLPALGTPRSPDGRFLVSPSALGLLVTGERKELWQTDKLTEHADAARYTDCVVANDARAIACIDSGRAIVFERPKQTASSTHK